MAFVAIISFSCEQPAAKKMDAFALNEETTISLVNASSFHVPAAITEKNSKAKANKPACCTKVPSRFKLNTEN
jgi:hypothetical protein